MQDVTVTITGSVDVNIPAVSEYVAYLRERDATQKQLDELAAEFRRVTGRQHTSTDKVQQAIDSQSKG